MELSKGNIVRYKCDGKDYRGEIVNILEPEFKDGTVLYVVECLDRDYLSIKQIIKAMDILSVEAA